MKQARVLVISTSLNPSSSSKILAKRAFEYLAKNVSAEFIDLRDYELPLCDGNAAYSHPNVQVLSDKVKEADCILLGCPIYNWDVNAALKNMVELTGNAWNEKIVGFLCAAGGKFSYMSVMSLANSLMLDFRCLIIPRFVYADSTIFQVSELDQSVVTRIHELCDEGLKLIGRLNAAL